MPRLTSPYPLFRLYPHHSIMSLFHAHSFLSHTHNNHSLSPPYHIILPLHMTSSLLSPPHRIISFPSTSHNSLSLPCHHLLLSLLHRISLPFPPSTSHHSLYPYSLLSPSSLSLDIRRSLNLFPHPHGSPQSRTLPLDPSIPPWLLPSSRSHPLPLPLG